MKLRNLLVLALTTLMSTGCFMAPLASAGWSSFAASSFAVQSTIATGISYVTTGKTISDHAISSAASQDCKLFNIVQGKPVCQEYEIASLTDKTVPSEPPNQTQTVADKKMSSQNEENILALK